MNEMSIAHPCFLDVHRMSALTMTFIHVMKTMWVQSASNMTSTFLSMFQLVQKNQLFFQTTLKLL